MPLSLFFGAQPVEVTEKKNKEYNLIEISEQVSKSLL